MGSTLIIAKISGLYENKHGSSSTQFAEVCNRANESYQTRHANLQVEMFPYDLFPFLIIILHFTYCNGHWNKAFFGVFIIDNIEYGIIFFFHFNIMQGYLEKSLK